VISCYCNTFGICYLLSVTTVLELFVIYCAWKYCALYLFEIMCVTYLIDITRTKGAGLHWFLRVTECERSEYVRNRAGHWQYDAVAYVLTLSQLHAGCLL